MSHDGGEVAAAAAVALRTAYVGRLTLYSQVMCLLDAEELHPCYDGGRDSRGYRHKSVWPSLAQFGIARRYDPVAWVDCLFDHAHFFDRTPSPHDLRDQRVLDAMAGASARRRRDLLFRAKAERLAVLRQVWFLKKAAGLSQERAARLALADPALEAAALTRFLFAHQYGLSAEASALFAAAAAEYATDPGACEEAYAGMEIPDALRRASNGPE